MEGKKEKKKRLNLDWCTCIEQMQRFTILFLWNKESCVLQRIYFLSFFFLSLFKETNIYILCH